MIPLKIGFLKLCQTPLVLLHGPQLETKCFGVQRATHAHFNQGEWNNLPVLRLTSHMVCPVSPFDTSTL